MQSSLAERRAFIRSFVKEVRVTDGKVLLLYKIPLPPEKIVKDWAEVLSIVQNGSGGDLMQTNDLRVMSPQNSVA